jgi:lysophospholipase L1-like esterase
MKSFFLFLCVILPASAVTFQDDDTIVLLGNTFIERAQKYGHLETALALAVDKKNLKFRNLGWSGDTVFGHARSYFGPPAEGFKRLTADLTELKPNVVVVCYGAGAAFDGKEGLSEFLAGYQSLVEMIQSSAKPREIVIVSPPPAETLPPPMPDMSAHNKNLALYSSALEKFARDQKLQFADLHSTIGPAKGLTDNGLHFTDKGYESIAPKFVESLGLKNSAQLGHGSVKAFREEIVAKNKLFFFRWRPANETYLRLFRKHEQGQNVKELPMFDPLIEKSEKDIESLRTSILALK